MTNIHLPASGLAEDILENYKEEPKDFHLVTFNLGEEYGVPISQVQEIVRVGGITMVPNSPAYMEGVINLRGWVLPVLNLRKRLGLSEKAITNASRIVVTEIGNKVIGLLVDAVSHVIKIPSGHVEPPPEEVLEIDTDYITGVGKLNDKMIILLDLGKLLKREKLEAADAGDEGNEI
jgi:purine-binding chemotaxis protein CheW